MAPQFREMGIAYYVNRTSQAGIYWVQLFGARASGNNLDFNRRRCESRS
jgi:hypothetical protein